MNRYSPSKNYRTAGVLMLVLSGLAGGLATIWLPAVVPGVLFLLTAMLMLLLYSRPPIEVHPHHLRIGGLVASWTDIIRVDKTGWISPLIVQLTLVDQRRFLMIYPGDLESANRLLRQLRRCAQSALIDGIPHADYWGDDLAEEDAPTPGPPAPRYPLLREDDEADVERLFQRLKTVGHLDPKDEG